ncbi:hypothetical protein [Nocardia sp. CA-119907]|uniref:hypothetical protein n=1 Tax=Nocardia sp. CA-119907 TaxID=3239973 RepID=UPI003D993E37
MAETSDRLDRRARSAESGTDRHDGAPRACDPVVVTVLQSFNKLILATAQQYLSFCDERFGGGRNGPIEERHR